jgi:hypothetical protein
MNEPSFTEITLRKNLISSTNKKYLEYLKELQRSLRNVLHNREQRTDPSATPESTSRGVKKMLWILTVQ